MCTSSDIRDPQLFFPCPCSLNIVPTAPVTMGMTLTFEALFMRLTSNASSWYLSIFSFCVFMVFWSADTAISIKIRSFSCFSRTVISGLLSFNFFSVQAVMSYVSFTLSFYLISKDWRLYHLLEAANPYILLISYPVFFLKHLHDSSVLIFSAFLLNSPCKAFSFQFFFVTSSFIVVFQILLPLKYFLVANSYQYPPLLS